MYRREKRIQMDSTPLVASINIIYFATVMNLNSPCDVKSAHAVAKTGAHLYAINTDAVFMTLRTASRTVAELLRSKCAIASREVILEVIFRPAKRPPSVYTRGRRGARAPRRTLEVLQRLSKRQCHHGVKVQLCLRRL